MSNNSTKAVIATIDLGFTKIDGLMLPDGSYAIAVPQLAELFSFDKNQASRDLKALLGNGFQSHQKVKTATILNNFLSTEYISIFKVCVHIKNILDKFP